MNDPMTPETDHLTEPIPTSESEPIPAAPERAYTGPQRPWTEAEKSAIHRILAKAIYKGEGKIDWKATEPLIQEEYAYLAAQGRPRWGIRFQIYKQEGRAHSTGARYQKKNKGHNPAPDFTNTWTVEEESWVEAIADANTKPGGGISWAKSYTTSAVLWGKLKAHGRTEAAVMKHYRDAHPLGSSTTKGALYQRDWRQKQKEKLRQREYRANKLSPLDAAADRVRNMPTPTAPTPPAEPQGQPLKFCPCCGASLMPFMAAASIGGRR